MAFGGGITAVPVLNTKGICDRDIALNDLQPMSCARESDILFKFWPNVCSFVWQLLFEACPKLDGPKVGLYDKLLYACSCRYPRFWRTLHMSSNHLFSHTAHYEAGSILLLCPYFRRSVLLKCLRVKKGQCLGFLPVKGTDRAVCWGPLPSHEVCSIQR